MENQKLPNATAVLILGILSIITCCCYGIFSVILGTIGIVLANKEVYKKGEYKFNEEITITVKPD